MAFSPVSVLSLYPGSTQERVAKKVSSFIKRYHVLATWEAEAGGMHFKARPRKS
jgi:hypothetical protein